ncbi:hypothetical protein WR25_02360 [Diploscapter pachys]|uniref:Uncharacterized protein n=1 Tax=Diploscapter pachys TaxID=2018661 RepID=A0A2A2JZW0_9BILA|nr:hypothetical protein WR25_02360 [Diploscapter pachys]
MVQRIAGCLLDGLLSRFEGNDIDLGCHLRIVTQVPEEELELCDGPFGVRDEPLDQLAQHISHRVGGEGVCRRLQRLLWHVDQRLVDRIEQLLLGVKNIMQRCQR